MVEHVVFIKTNAAPLEWTDKLRKLAGDPAPVLKEKDMFYISLPAFLPFTRALLAMAQLPIEIVDISGHAALQLKVSCPPATGADFESMMKAQCVPGARVVFRFQFPNGCLDDRWHFSARPPSHAACTVPSLLLTDPHTLTGPRRRCVLARLCSIHQHAAYAALAQHRNIPGNAAPPPRYQQNPLLTPLAGV